MRGSGPACIIADPLVFYYATLATVAVLYASSSGASCSSPFGLTLRGIRDSESRMRSLGYRRAAASVHRLHRLRLLCRRRRRALRAVQQLRQPVDRAAVAIGRGPPDGDRRRHWHAVRRLRGAAAIIVLENFVSEYTERWPMVLGLMFIVTMIFAPEGILGAAAQALRSGSEATKHRQKRPVHRKEGESWIADNF